MLLCSQCYPGGLGSPSFERYSTKVGISITKYLITNNTNKFIKHNNDHNNNNLLLCTFPNTKHVTRTWPNLSLQHLQTCNPDQLGRSRQNPRKRTKRTTRNITPLSHRTESQMGQWKPNTYKTNPQQKPSLCFQTQSRKMGQYMPNHVIK
jgi:hypothetical protein